jgi:selT/selW/selH-like putative selenoprotein
LSAELKSCFPDVLIELIPEGKGIFDIKINGELIYSKYVTGRFPKSGEITDLLND